MIDSAIAKAVVVFGGSLLSVDALDIGRSLSEQVVAAAGAVVAVRLLWGAVIRPAVRRLLHDALSTSPLFDEHNDTSIPARMDRLERKQSQDIRSVHERIDHLHDR